MTRDMPKKFFSEADLKLLFRMKTQNYSIQQIADALNCGKSAVKMRISRAKLVAGMPPKEKLSRSTIKGRLANLTKRLIREHPKTPYSDIPGKLKELYDVKDDLPSYKAFERFLKRSNYKIVKLLKKPFVSSVNMTKRIDFAKNNIEKSPEFWDKVIWSDETMVRSLPKNIEIFVKTNQTDWREKMGQNHQVQNGGFGVMFWGCFSGLGLGPIVAIEESLNSEAYIELLKDHLIPEIKAVGGNVVFMQDNAPCHKSKAVIEFLRQENVTTLDWPPQSPDLNPIENLWALIKRKLKKKFSTPKTRDQLIDQVFEVWEDIDSDLRNNLVKSMTNRLKEVLEKKGRSINY